MVARLGFLGETALPLLMWRHCAVPLGQGWGLLVAIRLHDLVVIVTLGLTVLSWPLRLLPQNLVHVHALTRDLTGTDSARAARATSRPASRRPLNDRPTVAVQSQPPRTHASGQAMHYLVIMQWNPEMIY